MDNADNWNGDIPFISAAAMHDAYIDGSAQRITSLGLEKGSKLLKKGNLLLLVRGSMLWNRIPICYNNVDVAFNQDVKGIIPNSEAMSSFLLYWFYSQENRLLYRVTGTGIGAGKLDTSELLALPFHMPSKEEMNKISDCLKVIDERIATQNKIIEKLQSLIKGLENFILNNSSWNKVPLKSILKFYSTNSLSWEQLDNANANGVKNLHYGLIHSSMSSVIDVLKLPTIPSKFMPKSYEICKDGDIVFADASEDTKEIAKAVEFYCCKGANAVCGLHTIHARDVKDMTIVGFKGRACNSKYFHDQIRRLSQGTKVFSITTNNISECYIYIPDKTKQKQIVYLFSLLDEKLHIQQNLQQAYIVQKHYLLQQMFI